MPKTVLVSDTYQNQNSGINFDILFCGMDGRGRRITMDIRKGEVFRHFSNGVSFTIKQIVNNMAVLESQDGKREILREVDTLKLRSFYIPISIDLLSRNPHSLVA